MEDNKINEDVTVTAKEQVKESYTKQEVESLLQAETDKRVTEALKRAEKKNEFKVREAEKLASMNEEQKYKYQLEQRELTIAEKEKALSLMENKAEASKILSEKGLSLEFVDFVVAQDADTMMEGINKITKAFESSVRNEVEKRLRGTTPKRANADNGALTKEGFSKLSLSEQAVIFNTNPDLYKQLAK